MGDGWSSGSGSDSESFVRSLVRFDLIHQRRKKKQSKQLSAGVKNAHNTLMAVCVSASCSLRGDLIFFLPPPPPPHTSSTTRGQRGGSHRNTFLIESPEQTARIQHFMQILLDFSTRQKVLLSKSLSLDASQAARVATSGEVTAGRP